MPGRDKSILGTVSIILQFMVAPAVVIAAFKIPVSRADRAAVKFIAPCQVHARITNRSGITRRVGWQVEQVSTDDRSRSFGYTRHAVHRIAPLQVELQA